MFSHKMKMLGWFFCYLLLHTIVFSNEYINNWISTDDLYNIKINMSIEDVKNKLGDPLFIESIDDDGTILIKYIYGFRTKVYDKEKLESSDGNIVNMVADWGSETNIQFLFIDEKLNSWEEDKLTMSMAKTSKDSGSAFDTFNLLLNIVVITLNAAVLMSH